MNSFSNDLYKCYQVEVEFYTFCGKIIPMHYLSNCNKDRVMCYFSKHLIYTTNVHPTRHTKFMHVKFEVVHIRNKPHLELFMEPLECHCVCVCSCVSKRHELCARSTSYRIYSCCQVWKECVAVVEQAMVFTATTRHSSL